MSQSLKKLTLKGFKSIESLVNFELRPLNILIGANGSGKSNFVDFFRMLRAMADEGLQEFVRKRGRPDQFFYLGPRNTRQITSRLEFGKNVYEFDISLSAANILVLDEERDQYTGSELAKKRVISRGVLESVLKSHKDAQSPWGPYKGLEHYVYAAVSSWTVYHFHDTSSPAPMRRDQPVRDRATLRDDASNLAAFLLNLREKYKASYDLIRDAIRMIAPFFDDFILEPEVKGQEEIVRLEWRQKGSDYPFQPYQLSDGTIRFICLASALLQPRLPATIVIDEPELGLHPYAIALLANMIQSAAERTQVVISTQSTTLLDQFENPEDVIVVNRQAGCSTFERLDASGLREWLNEYSVAELWQKDVLRGGPASE